jgi:DNA-binding HxlR family transcriptional regulator
MEAHFPSKCNSVIGPLRDALEVVNGKWKLQILVAIRSGNHRFRDIERSIPLLSSKVLSKELKDLEAHHLISRTVHEGPPVTVEYEALPYALTLDPVIFALRDWGVAHRQKITGKVAAPVVS